MAKTIKFNLILDGHSVRTLEELQEHFSIEDILNYHKNGLLIRWLDTRSYEAQRDAVEKLTGKDDKITIKELIRIFNVGISPDDAEKAISVFGYLEEQKRLEEKYQANAFSTNQIIEDYHAGYDSLIQHIENNKDNIALIKADVIEMERKYFELFKLDQYNLYFRLLEKSPKAIYAMLTRQAFRDYFLGEKVAKNIQKSIEDDLSAPARIIEILGADLKEVKQDTQGNWDPIEPPQIEVMVLNISTGTHVRNADVRTEKFDSSVVNKKYKLLKGLDFQSKGYANDLLYMEV